MAKIVIVFVLFLQFATLYGRWDRITTSGWKGDYCSYKGYAPGGNKVEVKRITSPVAKLQGSVMAQVMSNAGKTATFAMHSMNMVAQLSSKFTMIPGIGPALGAFGVVFGALGAASKPTPADILKATNKAIAKLTEEVNDRMEEMKGYVDGKVIDMEKSLITREYKSLFILWSNCVENKGAEEINECQRDAAAAIIAAKPKFTISPSSSNDVYGVKRLEASLIAFRDYATLSVMCLKGLRDTYKAGAPAADDHYFKLYERKLKEEVKSFDTYLTNAVKMIVDMHYRNGNGQCADTFKCDGLHEIKEGWLVKVHTASWTNCYCTFDPADVNTKKCGKGFTIRTDGKPVGSPYLKIHTVSNDYYGACQKYGLKLIMDGKGKAYLNAMKTAIENTWKNEVMDLLPAWKTVAGLDDGTKRDLSLGYSDDTNELEFSDNYHWRLAVAYQMADDFDKYYKVKNAADNFPHPIDNQMSNDFVNPIDNEMPDDFVNSDNEMSDDFANPSDNQMSDDYVNPSDNQMSDDFVNSDNQMSDDFVQQSDNQMPVDFVNSDNQMPVDFVQSDITGSL